MLNTSASLLDYFNRLIGRTGADALQATDKYKWLADAEKEVVSRIAAIKPSVLYQKVGTSSLPTLVTSDNNVFTFGTDGSGNAIVPFGTVQIYRRLTDIPDRPLVVDWDYLDEVTQIRLPRNRKNTDTWYWRGIVMPADISATENPHLNPLDANELTALKAAANFSEGGNIRNERLADRMEARYEKRLQHWALVWKKQFSRGGVLTAWSARDLVTPLL